MTVELTAARVESRVVTLPVDHAGWMAWLIENTEPDWRPDEWDAANWLFTGDPDKDETAIWRCNSAGCHVAVRATRHLCRSCYEQLRSEPRGVRRGRPPSDDSLPAGGTAVVLGRA
jgi:hypothetical protein